MTNSYKLGPFDWQPMVIELDSAPPTDPCWVTRPEPGGWVPKVKGLHYHTALSERKMEREKSNEGLSISKVFNYLHSGPCPTCSLTPADTTNNTLILGLIRWMDTAMLVQDALMFICLTHKSTFSNLQIWRKLNQILTSANNGDIIEVIHWDGDLFGLSGT